MRTLRRRDVLRLRRFGLDGGSGAHLEASRWASSGRSFWKCCCTIEESNGPLRSPRSIATSTDSPSRSGLSSGSCPVDHNFDRHALHDLDPVAGRIFRRQQRERRAGAHADRIDVALIGVAGINVGDDLRLLADAHVGELGLLEIRHDVEIAERNDRHQRLAELDAIADVSALMRHDAGERRREFGIGEIELGRFQSGFAPA